MTYHEIVYERDINRSYMKLPAIGAESLDEKLIFRKPYPGILSMEKCYVDGRGQYWYDISGKQALDEYCRINAIHHSFFEMLILRICSQLEILEWNLIDTRCLVVNPEFIFLNHSGEDIFFVLHPEPCENFLDELRQLMEFLITKLNHSDKDGVHQVYHIYNMILSEGCSMADLKQSIFHKKVTEEMVLEETQEIFEETNKIESPREDIFKNMKRKVLRLLEGVKDILQIKRNDIPIVVYPEDDVNPIEPMVHPTICLTAAIDEPRGVLIYEGPMDYPDFNLEKEGCILGKNPRVKLYVNRETISQFHAKFDYADAKYYVEDMNSTNGTFVNDEMLHYKEKKILSPGDVLRFADVKYRFL